MIRLLLLAAIVGLVAYAVIRWRRERREDTLLRARAAFFVASNEPAAPRREPPPLRTVDLGDGRLRFRVPAAWDGEPSPRGILEARASSSRCLRVELRTLERGGAVDAAHLADTLRESKPGRQGVVEVLPGGRVLLKHVRADRGDGGPDLTYCWEIWAPRPGEGALVGEFAFRVPAAATDAITEDDVRLLEHEIREATLSDPT